MTVNLDCTATTEPLDLVAGPGALGVDDLKELMRAVQDTTERLEHTHLTLQSEVVRLQGELAEANAQLRRSRELAALGEMAAGIAHEIRNPLGSIHLYAQALGEDLADRPDQQRLCEKIGRAVLGLDGIVRDVLTFARELRLRPEETTVRAVLGQALQHCEALIEEGGVDVEIDLPEARERPITADVCLMAQAIANVVRNAVEAMVEAGASARRLLVTADRRRVRGPDGRRAVCTVIIFDDTGPGIRPEVVARMFNPFFTTRTAGTGLGLAIVHRIVDAHDGHVGVSRAGIGGARVELRLPATSPVFSLPSPNAEACP